eukprot:gene11077-3783_t
MKCYYETLGVEPTATESEIKKAYFKLAFKHHPDRNENSEESTKIFTQLQSAYETLMDPQERAWYDDHKNSILKGVDPDEKPEFVNLWPFFNNNAFSTYDEGDEDNFYDVYSELFQTIYEEEKSFETKGKTIKKPPSFGDSKTSYSEAIQFYNYWSSFNSIKSYGWVDEHKPSDAPNRLTRRYIEQENKKKRDGEKKEFNELVKKLTNYVRRRDPRIMKEEERRKKQKEKAEKDKLEKEQFIEEEMKKWKKNRKKNEDLGAGIETVDDELQDDLEILLELQRNNKKKKGKKKKQWDTSSDEEEKIEEIIPSEDEEEEEIQIEQEQEQEENGTEEKKEEKSHAQSKREKKNKKKKEKEKKPKQSTSLKCNVCAEIFATKNKLFHHLKTEGHESAVDISSQPKIEEYESKGKKKKAKKK